jgi:hypothetical protein
LSGKLIVRKTVLSAADAVAPLSTAIHCRSSTTSGLEIALFLQLPPWSLEIATPTFVSASRSEK